jgi:murein DD-endopeptidase MepM/ murein hydrolase activator NlpD
MVGLLVCALVPTAGGTAGGQTDDLSRVRDRIDAARSGLADIEGRQAATVADLQGSEARQAELAGQLQALEQELATAEVALRAAEDALAATNAELVRVQDRLGAQRVELSELRAGFRRRARASYVYGAVHTPGQILEVRDIAELQRALTYMNEVLEEDREHVDDAAALEGRIARDADALDGLQEAQVAQRTAAERDRDRVGDLVERQRALTAEAEAEVARHREILEGLERDERAHRGLIDELAAESRRIEAELATRSSGGAPPPSRPGALQAPVGGRRTSSFGWRTHPIFGTRKLHTGMDFGAPAGTPIYAASDGVVVSAGTRGGYGNATVIDHGGGVATLYAHQSRLGVRPGQRVARGELIGWVGSTGFSTGPHLHFEVRVNGTPVDPAGYL